VFLRKEVVMSDSKYLEMLAKEYPNHRAVKSEIINLKAILALPKGTEYFLSDLHGEYDAFQYMVRSASGTIKEKIDENYGNVLSDEDRDDLASKKMKVEELAKFIKP
jgi:fructose-1,6-bisphosphatase-3